MKDKSVDMTRFYESYKAGWREWKKKEEGEEEFSFEISMKSMNIDTEALADNPVH